MCYIANILVYSNLGVVVKTLDILASLTLKWRDISALSHETHETLSSGSPPHFLKGVHSVLLELSWFFAFLTAKMDPPVSDIVMSLHASSITITLSQVRGSKVSFFFISLHVLLDHIIPFLSTISCIDMYMYICR